VGGRSGHHREKISRQKQAFSSSQKAVGIIAVQLNAEAKRRKGWARA
jgi:hypothetical protein